jgi:hypothetical protein
MYSPWGEPRYQKLRLKGISPPPKNQQRTITEYQVSICGVTMKYIVCTITILMGIFAKVLSYQNVKPSSPLDSTICLAIGPKVYDWTKRILKASTIEELKKVAEKNECTFSEKDNVIYVIHEPSYGITALKRKLSFYSEISKSDVGFFSNLDESKLSAASFDYLVQHCADSPGFKNTYEKSNAPIFLQPSITITVESGGRKVDLDWMPGIPKDKAASLTPAAPSGDAKNDRSLPEINKALWEAGQGLSGATILFGGKEESLYSKTVLVQDIMKLISASVKENSDKLLEANNMFLESLMSKYQIELWNSNIANGAKSGNFNDLSQLGKDQFTGAIMANYESLGFKSADEAMMFLQGSDISNVHLQVGIACITMNGGNFVRTIAMLEPKGKTH